MIASLKYKGTAVVIEKKHKRLLKKTKDREEDAIRVLKEHGVINPIGVLKELMNARKGNEIEHEKILIKKLPDF